MSFFNPFRKNQRPEGVKLATMQTPEEAGCRAACRTHLWTENGAVIRTIQ